MSAAWDLWVKVQAFRAAAVNDHLTMERSEGDGAHLAHAERWATAAYPNITGAALAVLDLARAQTVRARNHFENGNLAKSESAALDAIRSFTLLLNTLSRRPGK